MAPKSFDLNFIHFRFEQSYGVAFTPCQLLLDHAKANKKFYN